MRKPRWPEGLAWVALAATLFGAAMLWVLGDRWWLTVPWLYGPRWIALTALLGCVPLLLSAPRRGVVFFCLIGGLLWFGVLGGVPGIGRLLPTPEGTALRVVTFNIQSGRGREADIGEWLVATDADLVILTECTAKSGRAIGESMPHFSQPGYALCLMSRHPILTWERRDPSDFWQEYGSAAIARATIAHPTLGELRIGIVHLATPRHVLDHFFDVSAIPTLGDTVRRNIDLRDRESAAARDWIGGPDVADIVAGDFNLPVESAIYRRHWGDFTNAFWHAGWGLGRTKHTRLIGVRIDHILLGDRLHARRTWVGPALGSDHRPVIAELRIRD